MKINSKGCFPWRTQTLCCSIAMGLSRKYSSIVPHTCFTYKDWSQWLLSNNLGKPRTAQDFSRQFTYCSVISQWCWNVLMTINYPQLCTIRTPSKDCVTIVHTWSTWSANCPGKHHTENLTLTLALDSQKLDRDWNLCSWGRRSFMEVHTWFLVTSILKRFQTQFSGGGGQQLVQRPQCGRDLMTRTKGCAFHMEFTKTALLHVNSAGRDFVTVLN